MLKWGSSIIQESGLGRGRVGAGTEGEKAGWDKGKGMLRLLCLCGDTEFRVG